MFEMIRCCFALAFALTWAVMAPASASAAMLVEQGEARSVVVLMDDAHEYERQAADELIEHIALISGATLEIVTPDGIPSGLTPIRIGAAADESLEAPVRERGDDPWAFALKVSDQAIALRGLAPEGTRSAAYELLEQLGVRWYMPGEIGRVLPERDTLELEAQETVQVPSFQKRRRARNHADTWNDRVRLGGVGRNPGAHGMRPWKSTSARNREFEENPEFFALIDGERRPRQLCVTNSTDNIEENQVLARVAEATREWFRENPDTDIKHVGPYDGGHYCQCEHCRALDAPQHVTTPFMTPTPSVSDRYVWFYEQVLKQIEDEFPDARLGFYAYGGLMLPPYHRDYEPSGRLAISVAPIHICRIHGPNNPACPESNLVGWLYEHWAPYVDEVWNRGYWFNLACPGFPFPMIHRMREEIPLAYENNVVGMRPNSSDAWATHNPSMYVAAKLMWDHTTDVDALLEEFYEKFYGPASEPMAAYHELMNATIRDADHHTGSSWDMPHIYPEAARSQAHGYLAEAASRAAYHDDAYATRIEITRMGLDWLDAYCELLEHRNNHRFIEEYAALERVRKLRDKLLEDYEYPMLWAPHTRFVERFIERMTVPGYEVIANGGEIVAQLEPEWQFQLDPESWGQYVGLHKPEMTGGNWLTIRTDTSWSNQGLRTYFGQVWYRQSVEIPAEYADRTVHIWFAGVDNTAEVWVNGQFVGANHGGAEFDIDAYGSAFRAFEFDATDAIRFGGTNVVTVRSVRPRTNELGTGGLIGPAMFYARSE